MHRDMKLGLALGVLLVGVVAAFFFRNEQQTTGLPPRLKDPNRLDRRISERRVGPYITGVETVDTRRSGNHRHNDTSKTVPPLWEMPDFLREADDDPVARARTAPDPIILDENDVFRDVPAPRHNNAWTVSTGTTYPANENREQPSGPRLGPEPVRIHEVRSGETLSGLAARYLGSSRRYNDIWALNRDILNSPDDLRVGMRIRIPQQNDLRDSTQNSNRVERPHSGVIHRPQPTTRNVSTRRSVRSSGRYDAYRQTPRRDAAPPSALPRRKFVPARSPFAPGGWGTRASTSAPLSTRRSLSQLPPIDIPDID